MDRLYLHSRAEGGPSGLASAGNVDSGPAHDPRRDGAEVLSLQSSAFERM